MSAAQSAIVNIEGIGGQLNYVYGFFKSTDESETATTTVGLNGTGHIYQPWFVKANASLNLIYSEARASTRPASSGESVTGSLGFSVFPFSRFPFSLDYKVTDSRNTVSGAQSSLSSTRSEQLMLRQNYHLKNGDRVSMWFNDNKYISPGLAESFSESYGARYGARLVKQVLNVATSVSRSGREGEGVGSEVRQSTADYRFVPSDDASVNAMGSRRLTTSSVDLAGPSESLSTQLSSSFSWSPKHLGLSASGGVVFGEMAAGSANQESLQRTFSSSATLSSKVNSNLTANLSTVFSAQSSAENTQSTSLTQGVSLGYLGDPVLIGMAVYSWGGSAGLSSGEVSERSEGVVVTDSVNIVSSNYSLQHRFRRRFAVGVRSQLSMSAGQGYNSTIKDKEQQQAIGNNAALNWSYTGGKGQGSANMTLSDNRDLSRDEVNQFMNTQLSLNYKISRLSSVSGSLAHQLTSQTVAGASGGTPQSLGGTMSYSHSRALGVYNLSFISALVVSSVGESEAELADVKSAELNTNFNYSIGLLTAFIRWNGRQLGGQESWIMSFGATRTF